MSAASAIATADGVPAHWAGRERFVVFDTGYGNGAGFAALLAAWRADPGAPAHLHYIALSSEPLPGFRRVPQPDPRVTLDLLNAPLDAALSQLDACIDYACLHGIATAGSGFARALARLSAPGTMVHGDGLTAAQLRALGSAGFAFGDSTRGVFISRKPLPPRRPTPLRRAIVIGAGLAGSAACERLCARGWRVDLVERHAEPAQEASGNLAGIFMPLLSRDDSIMTRLSRAAFLFALAHWERLGGVGGAIEGAACGVLQLARDAEHGKVQRAIAAAHSYPADFARWLDSDAAGAMLGASAPDGAWLFPRGGWVRPASVCAAMLAACGSGLQRHFGAGTVSLAREGALWRVLDAQGASLAEAPVLVLANGNGAAAMAQAAALPLLPVRGQVTHLAAGQVPGLPFVLCREAYLTPAAHGVHSLGASYDLAADPALCAASQRENLDKIRALLHDQGIGAGAPLAGRVGFRSVATDRLPLVGALPDAAAAGRIERLREVPRQPGLYCLLGYASRGLIWAPLAAELLAARLEGEPLPLEAELVKALDPARFLLRARRKNNSAIKATLI